MQKIILRTENLSKTFPGVQALKNINFELYKGEIHGIVGENGAGKSTFVKILGGIHQPDTGKIYLNGEQVEIRSPRDAKRLGITLIHQEITLVPHLTVAENILLGRLPTKKLFGFISVLNYDEMYSKAEEILDRIGVNIPVTSKVKELSVGEQQIVEIARALADEAQIICMDEPTSALSPYEIERLFDVIRSLKNGNVSVIYISHHINEIFEICDRVTVFRDGEKIGTFRVSDVTPEKIITLMIGRKLSQFYAYREKSTAIWETPILEIRNLSTRPIGAKALRLEKISLKVYPGEILGIFGLMGAGKTELAKAVFGVYKIEKGEILLEGEKIDIRRPLDAKRYGIVYVPEDRLREGLVLSMPVKCNITLPCLDNLTGSILIPQELERDIAMKWVNALRIAVPHIDFRAANLSGGNKQKVVIAKWLEMKPKVIIFDEPTMGIDVGAKEEIRKIISDLALQGIGIILISSEAEEVMSLADRIVVMRNGKIIGEFDRREVTKDDLLALASGVRREVKEDTKMGG